MKKINIPAVIVAGIAYWFVQAAWFTLLGERWVAALGTTGEQLRAAVGSSPTPYIVALVSNIAMAWVLAWVVAQGTNPTAACGAKIGVLMWLGFLATSYATSYVFRANSVMLYALDTGSMLVGLIVMGLIIGAWKKKGAEVVRTAAA